MNLKLHKVTMTEPVFVPRTKDHAAGYAITVRELEGDKRETVAYGDTEEDAEANAYYAATCAHTRLVQIETVYA